MTIQRLTVLAKARSGRLDEFERWYDEVHIPEILERYPEVSSVVRYRLSASLTHGVDDLHDSAAVYEVQGSAAELWDRLAADRSMTVGQGFDYKRTVTTFSL
ncbi:hypothetical protein [Rhodococcus koreensis]|uniref:EthD domain-containing protein n=1 Tax=Rhodococcus koreensis TaxID=99653 RepID=A0A1H4KXP6_9NOCA|nr:hypothetical protein [Rhodococcus koreensis]SEB63319.1 hypothetical protein SAMN04490239_0974 [Rhodococcus koreensis]